MVGVGIVGCGLIGTKRAQQLPSGLELRRAFDIDNTRAERLITKAGGDSSSVARTLDDLITDPAVGLVIVATTHDGLADVALQAVEASKHVLVEKPGATSSKALTEIRDAASANDVVVRVGFNHRFHPAVLELSEVVRDDRYGRLLFVRARYGHGGRLGYEREWRADAARSGGGELIDQGAHLIDLVRWLFGGAELAFAETPTSYWPMEVEDNAFVALRPCVGGFAWLHASWTEWKNTFSFEVMLERAKLEVNGLGGSYGPERLTVHEMPRHLGPPPSFTREWPPADRSWGDELADVAAAMAGAPSRGATVDDGIATLQLIEEAYRS